MIFIILIILLCVFAIYQANVKENILEHVISLPVKNESLVHLSQTNVPKIVWTYWENKDGRTELPTHIKLCFETFYKHLSHDYQIIILDQNTIKNYLPDVRTDIDDLMIAQKVDYYRIALLHKYGGIWIDADTLVMRNFDEIFEKLDVNYDFVGFGCTAVTCFNGKWQPSNWALASRPNGILMRSCLDKLNKKLDDRKIFSEAIDYHDMGKYIIWTSLTELKEKQGYDYYHFPAEYDGSRDSDGYWIDNNRHFNETPIKLINEDKLFFVFLTNAGINADQPWVKDSKREDLLNGKYWISSMFRKSLE